jgi:DNA repair exonuclease SbcCD ATPase subunit
MKRFSLMAAVGALLGSSIAQASPAFKKYKDALVAYKKDSSDAKANAVNAAYEALGGPRGLRGDILARDQYAVIAVGKERADELGARRRIMRGAPSASGTVDKALQQQIQQLQSDLAAIKTTEAAANAEKTRLEEEIVALKAAKATGAATAASEIARLNTEIQALSFKIDRTRTEADLKANLTAALGKADVVEKIAGITDIIAKLADIKELLAIVVGGDGIAKIDIARIPNTQATALQRLNDLAAALKAKSDKLGVDNTAVIKIITDKAKAIEKAGSAVDWLAQGVDLQLGKKGQIVLIKDAIQLIRSEEDLINYVATIIGLIAEKIGIENTILEDADNLDDQTKQDYESFYIDYLAFVNRAIDYADKNIKNLPKDNAGYVLLITARDAITNILPELITITGGAAKKAETGGGVPGGASVTKLPLTGLDMAAISTFDTAAKAEAEGARILGLSDFKNLDYDDRNDHPKAKEYKQYLIALIRVPGYSEIAKASPQKQINDMIAAGI